MWGDGWLGKMGLMDFAGGTVVHLNAGMAALVAAVVLGTAPRLSRHADAAAQPDHDRRRRRPCCGSGWFGFNAGSALAADGAAGMAMLVTHIGAATGAFAWMVCEWARYGKPSVLGIVTGMVAGLGTITPASGFVGPIGALAIGAAAGVLCFFATSFMKRSLGVDDSLDVFPVHGVGGVLGTTLTGVFAAAALGGVGYPEGQTMGGQVLVQLAGVVAVGPVVGGDHLRAAQAERRGGRHARQRRRRKPKGSTPSCTTRRVTTSDAAPRRDDARIDSRGPRR